MSNYKHDPIWGTPARVGDRVGPRENSLFYQCVDSSRCGGPYVISESSDYEVTNHIKHFDDRRKARLTSWLIKQRSIGDRCPMITMAVVEFAKQKSDMSTSDRTDMILKYIQSKTRVLGKSIVFYRSIRIEDIIHNNDPFNEISLTEKHEIYYNLLAYSESTIYSELKFLLEYLSKRSWIECDTVHNSILLTVDGCIRIAEIQETKVVSSRGFMAMWFDQSMDKIWQEGFEPGIRKAGYEPMRIDQKQHVNKIDDEIISEIRRARFVVADFTQGETGARGGVYYEAGFAKGLGIPVIFTCRKDCLKTIHFDIRQYNCITWEKDDLKKLQEDLTNRITAILGDGPGRSAS